MHVDGDEDEGHAKGGYFIAMVHSAGDPALDDFLFPILEP